jgi:hypothetical protein
MNMPVLRFAAEESHAPVDSSSLKFVDFRPEAKPSPDALKARFWRWLLQQTWGEACLGHAAMP